MIAEFYLNDFFMKRNCQGKLFSALQRDENVNSLAVMREIILYGSFMQAGLMF